ncbi:FAD-dependent oxidoreductase [Halomonas sp. A29]|uniref:FAD-dependent oxidoreductase n=1 Tax=Halomonas sp. A29 TaxID=3102786 RepID=UPI00398B6FDF
MAETSEGHPPRILLIGAGHAHLHLMRHRARLPHAELTVVDPGSFWYSGMAAGVLGGAHAPGLDRIDPVRLAHRYRLDHARGRLAQLDIAGRRVHLEDGRTLPFDLLSLNVGSSALALPAVPDGPVVWTVKPIQQLVALRQRLLGACRRGEHPRIVVVGGGASGVEVACNLRALTAEYGTQAAITLVNRDSTLLASAPAGAQRWLERHLHRLGIQLRSGLSAVAHHREGVLVAEENVAGQDNLGLLECDHIVHACGLAPPAVLERLGLTLIAGRGVAVRSTLQSVDHPDIFAAGDCAAMVDHILPRLGVYGVRQAPVLLTNLAARLGNHSLQCYVPQSKALSILDLGQGQGLAFRGRLWWAGRLSLRWKRWLDGRFMTQYRC